MDPSEKKERRENAWFGRKTKTISAHIEPVHRDRRFLCGLFADLQPVLARDPFALHVLAVCLAAGPGRPARWPGRAGASAACRRGAGGGKGPLSVRDRLRDRGEHAQGDPGDRRKRLRLYDDPDGRRDRDAGGGSGFWHLCGADCRPPGIKNVSVQHPVPLSARNCRCIAPAIWGC